MLDFIPWQLKEHILRSLGIYRGALPLVHLSIINTQEIRIQTVNAKALQRQTKAALT